MRRRKALSAQTLRVARRTDIRPYWQKQAITREVQTLDRAQSPFETITPASFTLKFDRYHFGALAIQTCDLER